MMNPAAAVLPAALEMKTVARSALPGTPEELTATPVAPDAAITESVLKSLPEGINKKGLPERGAP